MDQTLTNAFRWSTWLLAAATSFMIFITTERCFSQADVRSAVKMVTTLRATDDAMTIPQAICQQHAALKPDDIAWSGMLTDNCYGFVRVRAAVPGRGQVIEYLFDVNLTGQRLHPANGQARQLMKSLGRPASDKDPL